MENYESLGVIGEGTYGVVMKARHKETGQVVAIKKFKESDEDEQVRKTSLREVRVLKQLRHDNVITLLEVFRRKGKLYLVFEYVEKTILEVLEKKPNGLDEQEVRRYTYQLLRGVEYCHANNIIHRDVKPENILISRNGALKICDFGFARPMSVGGKYTDYVATRWYRCPELLVGDVEYGKGVDVWAIGCIFAEISNGMPLFAGESDPDQLAHIIRCNGKLTSRQTQIFRRNPLYVGVELPPVPPELESLDSRFPNVPKNWLNFLKGCLRNDPDQRETCASLIAMPYFTDRNWRAEYDAELKMIMDKENRSNALKRPSESAPSRASEGMSQDLHARPVSMGSQPTEAGEGKIPPVPAKHSPVLPVNGGYPTASGHPSSHSVWSQFLQSTGPEQAASPPALFPGLSGAKPPAPSPVSYGGVAHSQSSFLPQAGIHGASKGPPLGGHSGNSGYTPASHGYLTTFGHSEPLMVTNSLASKSGQGQAGAGAYGMSSKKVPVPTSQQTASSPSGGTMLPTLGTGSVAGGGLAINPVPSPWSLPSSTPVTSQERSGVTAPAATASQLAYKKKPGKRNVLSTLSLTAFGAQQGTGVDTPAPSAGGSGAFMMHGQAHAMDHPAHGNPSRRGSKPWNG